MIQRMIAIDSRTSVGWRPVVHVVEILKLAFHTTSQLQVEQTSVLHCLVSRHLTLRCESARMEQTGSTTCLKHCLLPSVEE